MIPIIYPYKIGSGSAKSLSQNLDTKRVRRNGKYKYKNNHLIMNWGSSFKPIWANLAPNLQVLNHWDKIAISHNKLTALQKLKENKVNTVEFTTDIQVAKGWINDDFVVMCRTQLTNHSGYGIVIATNEKELVPCPLFTKYVKGGEFRIHVFKHGNDYVVFDAQQKKQRKDFEGKISPFIRSHHRGYVFTRENIEIPDIVKTEAINSLKALGLDFGGVDIKYNKYNKQAYVLEVNSSVGLEGQTLKNYTHEFLVDCQKNKV